jgi:hypothetical protein
MTHVRHNFKYVSPNQLLSGGKGSESTHLHKRI